jgi:hypothetical protein
MPISGPRGCALLFLIDHFQCVYCFSLEMTVSCSISSSKIDSRQNDAWATSETRRNRQMGRCRGDGGLNLRKRFRFLLSVGVPVCGIFRFDGHSESCFTYGSHCALLWKANCWANAPHSFTSSKGGNWSPKRRE